MDTCGHCGKEIDEEFHSTPTKVNGVPWHFECYFALWMRGEKWLT